MLNLSFKSFFQSCANPSIEYDKIQDLDIGTQILATNEDYALDNYPHTEDHNLMIFVILGKIEVNIYRKQPKNYVDYDKKDISFNIYDGKGDYVLNNERFSRITQIVEKGHWHTEPKDNYRKITVKGGSIILILKSPIDKCAEKFGLELSENNEFNWNGS